MNWSQSRENYERFERRWSQLHQVAHDLDLIKHEKSRLTWKLEEKYKIGIGRKKSENENSLLGFASLALKGRN